VDASRWIYLYPSEKVLEGLAGVNASTKSNLQEKAEFGYERKVDIVLETNTATHEEKWIELKSYGAKSETSRHLTKWYKEPILPWAIKESKKQRSKRQVMHKQFSIDRAAAHVTHAWKPMTNDPKQLVKVKTNPDFVWRFQEYKKRKAKGSPFVGLSVDATSNHKDSIKNTMSKKISNASSYKEMYKANFGEAPFSVNRHIEMGNMNALLQGLLSAGFSEASEAAISEIFE
jgi:hypothetical protein